MTESLVVLFRELERPRPTATGVRELVAVRVPGVENHRVAKDERGRPVVLIATADASGATPAPIALQNLSVEYAVLCRIRLQGQGSVDELFAVLTCTSLDENVQRLFLDVGTSLLRSLGVRPTSQSVGAQLMAFVDLFRALSHPPRKSVQGLWAEVFVIARSPDCARMVGAWHASPSERYDFALGRERVEVKVAVGREREHFFSLEQLVPPREASVLIASLCTERLGGGTSLGSLLDAVRSRIMSTPELLVRFESTVAATLGQALFAALPTAFDVEAAEQSLRLFDVAQIPRPPSPIPPEVSNVRFLANLTAASAVRPGSLKCVAGSLFEAVSPSGEAS